MSKAITIQTVVNTSKERAWECWNKPEHITCWAFASADWEAPAAENDLRAGGRFKTTMAAKLALHLRKQGRRPLLALGGLLVVVGIQLVSLGLLSEMITSQHEERLDERHSRARTASPRDGSAPHRVGRQEHGARTGAVRRQECPEHRGHQDVEDPLQPQRQDVEEGLAEPEQGNVPHPLGSRRVQHLLQGRHDEQRERSLRVAAAQRLEDPVVLANAESQHHDAHVVLAGRLRQPPDVLPDHSVLHLGPGVLSPAQEADDPQPVLRTLVQQPSQQRGGAAVPDDQRAVGDSPTATGPHDGGVRRHASAQQQGQSQEMVKQAQQKLSEQGHEVQADGILGPKTQAALKEFQQSKGLQASGQLDQQTLAALDVNEGSASTGSSSSASGTSSSEQSSSTPSSGASSEQSSQEKPAKKSY